jgi:ABC-type uncharacterized transport system permease subunit
LKALGTAALIALGLLVVLVATLLVLGFPVAASLQLLAQGAAGDQFGVSRSLVKATPLLLCGLGIVVAWRAGMYNIGGEGQLVFGLVVGAWAAKAFAGIPGPFLNPLILISCMLGGSAYAFLAGWLNVKRGVQVVISTILLNFVALQLLDWAVSGPLRQRSSTSPLTQPLPRSAMLAQFSPQMDLHVGIFIALAAALAVYGFLFLTKNGFLLRLVGENSRVAAANRIAPGRIQIGAMLISGALCGLAGGVEYTGITGSVGTGSAQGWGFLAIPVALLGGLHPLGAILSSIFFGALFAGSDNLSRFTPSGTMVVFVIQGLAVLSFIAIKAILDRRKVRPTEAAL